MEIPSMAEDICMNCGRGEWKHNGDAGCHSFVPWPTRAVNKQRIEEKKPLPVNVLVGGSPASGRAES
jgi:hypothetical protein